MPSLAAIWNQVPIRPAHAAADFTAWHRLLRRHGILFGGLAAVFILAYFGLEAYLGEGPHFLYRQRQLSHLFLGLVGLQLAHLILLNGATFRSVVAAFLYRPTSPYNLALMRAGVMLLLAGHLAFYVHGGQGQMASLPAEARQPLPFIGWLIDLLPISQGLYDGLLWTTVGTCLLAGFGLFTRYTLPLSAVLLLYVLGVPQFYGKIYHYHMMVWVPIYLAFSPCAEVFSVDAWRRKHKGPVPAPHARYGVAMKLVFLQIGVLYFSSAVGKLWDAGWTWALSDNIVNLMRLEWLEQYAEVPVLRMDRFPWLCRLAGTMVILFELAYIFLILTPRTRVTTALSAIGFHLSNAYFLSIDFAFLQYMNGYHFDWQGLYQRLKTRLTSPAGFVGTALILCALLAVWQVILGLALFVLLINRRFLTRHSSSAKTAPGPIPRWVMRVGTVLLLINLGFGLTQTSSWPFSAYPSYSFVRPAEVSYIGFVPVDGRGAKMDPDALGQAAGFRKEAILPLAERGAYLYREGQQTEFMEHTLNYWLRYMELVPALKEAESVGVQYELWSTDPDRLKAPVEVEEAGKLTRQGGKWTWNRPPDLLP